jgi:uncharacterized protein
MRQSSVLLMVLGLGAQLLLARGQEPPTSAPVASSQSSPASTSEFASEEITFRSGDSVLAGLLTLPPGGGPHSAVVLITGSGPQDRDGASRAIPGYQPFVLLADGLNRDGLAVLRYDDRGVGKSGGDYLAASEQDFVNDAAAAIEYLRGRKEIAHDKIGLLGQSEGGMIAAMVAAKDQRVAFVISLAGPAVKGYDLLVRQAERSARAEGMSTDDVAQVVREERRMFDLVLAQKWDDLRTAVHEVTLRRLEALPEAKKKLVGDLEAFAEKRTAQSMSAFQSERYQFILRHDSAEDWARVSVPVLALFGELDVQCDAAQNEPALEAALARGGNKNVTTVVIPAANHLFLQAQSGSMAEYMTLSKKEFAPGTLNAISDWLRKHPVRK